MKRRGRRKRRREEEERGERDGVKAVLKLVRNR